MNISVESEPLAVPTLRFVERLPVGVIALDCKVRLIWANDVATRLFRKQTGHVPAIDRPLAESLYQPRPGLDTDLAAAASGGRLGLRLGADCPVITCEVSYLRAERIYLVVLVRNDGMHRALSRMRQAHTDEVNTARHERMLRAEVESRARALETFSSMAAHDLKQPLRNIAHAMEFLTEDYGDTLPEDALHIIGLARKSAWRLKALVEGLLNHARLGWTDIVLNRVDLDAKLAEVMEDHASDLASLQAEIRVPERLGTTRAAGDFVRLLLQNLVSNALKYRHPERTPVVTITRSGAVLEIADNGRGFEAADAKRIFEPFTRLHSDSEIEGSGFGLASCRTIAMRMGWTLEAEGRPGEGATFRLKGLSR